MKIWPGDLIRLETRRGAVEVKVRSDRDVPENMVFMPFCYAEAAANLLTNPALDPFGRFPNSSSARSGPNRPRSAPRRSNPGFPGHVRRRSAVSKSRQPKFSQHSGS